MNISFINPLDQPLNKRRLLAELRDAITSGQFSTWRLASAAVTQGALLRLDPSLRAWRKKGATVEAIFGVDIESTSIEALNYALVNFDAVYVCRLPGIKFHPKLYIFEGAKGARVFYGSNNFTVPGTELNMEACVRIDFELPADAAQFTAVASGWESLLHEQASDTVFPLTSDVLGDLISEGLVVSEKTFRGSGEKGGSEGKSKSSKLPKSTLKKQPPSALPTDALKIAAVVAAPKHVSIAASAAALAATGIAMQIKVHHNGEIFLSKNAVNQNPAFFGWPFTGTTTPKKPGNPAYPERQPDPRVNIVVYGAPAAPLVALQSYALNTVYYSTKSEIRVTSSPLIGVVPDYSVMVMREPPEGSAIDYEIEIHTPASPSFAAWLAVCNQSMPGGGKTPRKFGWV